jgi:hypothetical protein
MKETTSTNECRRKDFRLSTLLRLFVGLAIGAAVAVLPLFHASAQNPDSGTIHATDTNTITWTGTHIAPGGVVTAESQCVDGVNCETFTLTVAGNPSDWVGSRVQVLLTWQQGANEYDIYIHQGSNSGMLVTSAIQGPGLTSQIAYIDIAQWGTGVFTIHVAHDITPASAADPYHGAVSVVAAIPAPAPAAAQDNGPKLGYQNYEAPGVLTQVTQTSSGALTVEYMGRGAGEPSIGANWSTGVVNMQSDLETLFITFNDTCPSNGQLSTNLSTWANRRATTSQFIDSDPIGFTDRQTGRIFAGELTLLSPTCKTSYSDDDGQTWIPTNGSGLASGVDHETIAGGPFHAPLTRPAGVPGVYPNAVYFCSQDLETALCSRSDDGGLTFGPSIPMYAFTECVAIHGHVKVSPVDGTVFVPNNNCNGEGAVAVSEDNGQTWSVRPVRSSTTDTASGHCDPAVAIDASNRVYFAIANNDNSCAVGWSDDLGRTWNNIVDVGAAYGLQNIRYPAAVAGDAGRAAVAFYGSTTPGDANSNSFNGIWHLYIAHTFDGGQTWTTTDATPSAPIQRGNIWTNGGANIGRNMLDFFDITIDKEGRVLVGYVNGCAGGDCAQSAPTASGNAYSATATIARQSSGRRLLAAFDPPNAMTATSAPGIPTVTERRVGPVVHLGWSEADTGNSPITSYRIMRGTASGSETLLATVPGTQTLYDDASATDTSKSYYYKVLAVNAVGTSCAASEIAAPYIGDTCSGIIIHRNDPTHPEAVGGTAANPPLPSMLIDYIAVGEAPDTNNLMFKMKVGDLSTIPPNSRWRIAWDSFSSPGQQYYVGMTTGATGAPTFEYGTLADAGVPAVLVISETRVGDPDPASNFNSDGTITIFVPKSAVGNPQPGDLLGAVNGRTITADTPATNTLERSTLFVDHTFVKGQADNSYPASTYTIAGNIQCSPFIEQVINSMVSLRTSNPSFVGGVASYNLTLTNTSTQTIFTPLRVEIAAISANATAANADNGQTGAGALWSYNNLVGSDSALSSGETSGARNLRFNDSGGPFSVTFNVVGNLARSTSGPSGGSAGSSSGGSSGGAGSGSSSSTTGTVTGLIFRVTYNPLLNTVTVELLRP